MVDLSAIIMSRELDMYITVGGVIIGVLVLITAVWWLIIQIKTRRNRW
jgi:hypothetical protein